MERLKSILESLDEAITELEDKIGLDISSRQQSLKNGIELLKQSRAREAKVLGVAQKVASRLDDSINHIESILRD